MNPILKESLKIVAFGLILTLLLALIGCASSDLRPRIGASKTTCGSPNEPALPAPVPAAGRLWRRGTMLRRLS